MSQTIAAPAPASSPARAIALFAVVATLVTVIAAGVLAMVFEGPGERRAVLLSAGVALGVQLLVFSGLRLAPRAHVIAAWGLGTLVRFAILFVYALVVVKALALPAAAALVSFVVCLFALTLLEPLFLRS